MYLTPSYRRQRVKTLPSQENSYSNSSESIYKNEVQDERKLRDIVEKTDKDESRKFRKKGRDETDSPRVSEPQEDSLTEEENVQTIDLSDPFIGIPESPNGFDTSINSGNIHELERMCKYGLECQKHKCDAIDSLINDICSEKDAVLAEIKEHSNSVNNLKVHVEKSHDDIKKCDEHMETLNNRISLIYNNLEKIKGKKDIISEELKRLEEANMFLEYKLDHLKKDLHAHDTLCSNHEKKIKEFERKYSNVMQ